MGLLRGKLGTGLLILACMWMSRHKLMSVLRPERPVPRTTMVRFEVCEAKQLCGVAYIAPWCPGCNQLISFFQSVAKLGGLHHGNYAAVVIVGRGRDAAENAAKAQEIGTEAIVDADGDLHEALAVDRYPTFLVIDQRGAVQMRGQDAMRWMEREIIGP